MSLRIGDMGIRTAAAAWPICWNLGIMVIGQTPWPQLGRLPRKSGCLTDECILAASDGNGGTSMDGGGVGCCRCDVTWMALAPTGGMGMSLYMASFSPWPNLESDLGPSSPNHLCFILLHWGEPRRDESRIARKNGQAEWACRFDT